MLSAKQEDIKNHFLNLSGIEQFTYNTNGQENYLNFFNEAFYKLIFCFHIFFHSHMLRLGYLVKLHISITI